MLLATVNGPSSSIWDCRLGPSALWGDSGWPVLPSCKESESQKVPIKGLLTLISTLNLGIHLCPKEHPFDPTQELSSVQFSSPLRTRPGPQSLPSDWALLPVGSHAGTACPPQFQELTLLDRSSVTHWGAPALTRRSPLIESHFILNLLPHPTPFICHPGATQLPSSAAAAWASALCTGSQVGFPVFVRISGSRCSKDCQVVQD